MYDKIHYKKKKKSLVTFQIAAFVLVSRVREKFQLPIAL